MNNTYENNLTENAFQYTNFSNTTYDSDLELTDAQTDQPYKDLINKIEKFCIPILCGVGTVGNILTILVLGKKRNRDTSVAVILLVLSVSDLIILFTGYFTQWLNLMWSIRIREIHDVTCKLHVFLTYVSLHISSWMLVLVTCERAFSVICPHRAKTVCDRRNTIIFIAITTAALLILDGHFLVGLGVQDETGFCGFVSDEYKDFITTAWTWIDFFVTFAVPVVFIIVGNTLIITFMKKNERKRSEMIVSMSRSMTRSISNSDQKSFMTHILILLSVIFIICTGPSSIINVMLSYLLMAGDEYQDRVLLFVREMAFLFSGLNATLNFFLYILSGSKFRADVKSLFEFKQKPKKHAINT